MAPSLILRLVAAPTASRLAYVDWLRGLACILMFQTHCYDAWLSPEARGTVFFKWSQIGGTLPAPLFLFMAGFSLAIVMQKLRSKNFRPSAIALKTIRRGAEVLGLGLLFRLQEYVISWGWAPKSDLARVDVLNAIGVSIILMGITCWIVTAMSRDGGSLRAPVMAAAGVAFAISLITPMLWTVWRPTWLPWPLESYVNGVHNLNQPQPWLFPIFPWAAFAFVGLAAGFSLHSGWARRLNAAAFMLAGAAGALIILLARSLDHSPFQLYPVYDFWHTSPNFFWIRVGIVLIILPLSYFLCQSAAGRRTFSPLIQLGQTSLLVYWVHIEFVYGRYSILTPRGVSIGKASLGLLTIFISMLLLSVLRTRLKRTARPTAA
ncbi:MAG: DUF1624 domain-containing protein [Acidobacteriales bacterium]|nr:DUF1624 domain-containing protein [Terriglobales bacterium]